MAKATKDKYTSLAERIATHCGFSIKQSGDDEHGFIIENTPLMIKIWTSNPAIRFLVNNHQPRSMQKQKVVGPWLWSKLDEEGIKYDKPDTNKKLESNSMEGQLVLFPKIGDPDKDAEDSILDEANKQYKRLRTLKLLEGQNFATFYKNNKGAIETWNADADHSQEVEEYCRQKMKGTTYAYEDPRHWWLNCNPKKKDFSFANLDIGKEENWNGKGTNNDKVKGNDLVLGYENKKIVCICSVTRKDKDGLWAKKILDLGTPVTKEDWKQDQTLNKNRQGTLFELSDEEWKGFMDLIEKRNPGTLEQLKGSNNDAEKLSRNLIYFGAPGTGKSFKLNEKVEAEFAGRYERVTFYPTYSYAQFVGCYKPTMESGKVGKAALILTPDQLVEELKNALAFWPERIKAKTGVTRSKQVGIMLFGEKFCESLEPLEKKDRERILKDAGAKSEYDQAYLEAGIAATIIRRHTSGISEDAIVYKFVPGPFLRILVRSLNNPDNDYCLVIEEINRANAAAVFGDVFQLLDRGSDGVSEYDVAASEDVKKFLQDGFKGTSRPQENDSEEDKKRNPLDFLKVQFKKDSNDWESCRLRIPPNMYIWATMNSADQGVFPMDTAFKRRWKFKYFGINQSDDKIENRKIGINLPIDEKQVYDTTNWNDGMRNWNNVRKFVNRLLTLFKVNEDKLMGPWFVQPESGDEISAEQFESKVLMYLWEDAARMCRQKMFPGSVTSYSELITEWRKQGVGVFAHLMGDSQIGGKDKNTDNSATNLWSALKVPTQQQ